MFMLETFAGSSIALPLLLSLVPGVLGFLWFIVCKRYKMPDSFIGLPAPGGGLPTWLGPLGGHTLFVNPRKSHEYLPRWGKYFDGDWRVFWIGSHIHMLSSPADINFVINQRPTLFRRSKFLGKIFDQIKLEGSLITAEKPEWGPLRRLATPPFNAQAVAAMLPSVNRLLERLISKWKEHAQAGETVEVKDDAMEFTLATIAMVGFGYDTRAFLPDSEKELVEAVKSYFAVIPDLMHNPFKAVLWRMLPLRVCGREIIHPLAAKEEFLAQDLFFTAKLNEVIDNISAGGDMSAKADGGEGLLMKKMMSVLKEENEKPEEGRAPASTVGETKGLKLTREQVINNMKTFFIAGRDTTANTIAWAVHFLASHPDKQEKLQKEVDEVLGDDSAPTSTVQVENLQYLNAVWRETLRLRAPVPNMFFHSQKPFTLPSGWSHPEGVDVGFAFDCFRLNDKYFTKADEFIPERWLSDEEREAALGKDAKHSPDLTWEFGGGPRICPGRTLAKLEFMACLATIAKKFEIMPDKSKPEVQQVAEFVTAADNVYVTLKKRADSVLKDGKNEDTMRGTEESSEIDSKKEQDKVQEKDSA